MSLNSKHNECKCKDWQENIDKLNAGFALSSIYSFGGYQGKIMEYCPWCGEKLISIND